MGSDESGDDFRSFSRFGLDKNRPAGLFRILYQERYAQTNLPGGSAGIKRIRDTIQRFSVHPTTVIGNADDYFTVYFLDRQHNIGSPGTYTIPGDIGYMKRQIIHIFRFK